LGCSCFRQVRFRGGDLLDGAWFAVLRGACFGEVGAISSEAFRGHRVAALGEVRYSGCALGCAVVGAVLGVRQVRLGCC
jgi:hypothetical protein